LGATIESIEVPVQGTAIQAVLSYSETAAYAHDTFCLGSTVGPYANRIRDGHFELDGVEYALQRNEVATGHCLHSGDSGLHAREFELHEDTDRNAIVCRMSLADGEGGFPGNRDVVVEYQLLSDFSLGIDFHVATDRTTVVSLANHAYFNLGGDIDNHEIMVRADQYLPVDKSNAPTGEIRDVADSMFDLREARRIGDTVFDHNFAFLAGAQDPRLVASLRSPLSGLQLDLLTTQPGLQVYTGDHLDDPFKSRQGICLEAQGFPDAPNQPGFPSARLEAGDVYRQRTIYEFRNLSE
jgi:aldose 1-epimerase